MKLLTSDTFLGMGHSLIALILDGFTAMPCAEIIYPRY
jgi:hypothetical protein